MPWASWGGLVREAKVGLARALIRLPATALLGTCPCALVPVAKRIELDLAWLRLLPQPGGPTIRPITESASGQLRKTQFLVRPLPEGPMAQVC